MRGTKTTAMEIERGMTGEWRGKAHGGGNVRILAMVRRGREEGGSGAYRWTVAILCVEADDREEDGGGGEDGDYPFRVQCPTQREI